MGEQRIINGMIYEKTPEGIVLVGPAGGAPQGVTATPLPVNPVRAAKEAQEKARQDRKDQEDAIKFAERNAPSLPAGFRWKNGQVGGEAEPIPGTDKASVTAEGKPLRQGDSDNLRKLGDNLANLQSLTDSFQPDFGGNLFGGLENTAQALNSGIGTDGQRQWWSEMAAVDNLIRNAQFGASLTAGEKAAYAKTTITPSMDPKEIQRNLSRRVKIMQGAASRYTGGLNAGGWNKAEIDALIGAQLKWGEQGPQQRADKEVDDPAIAADLKDDGPTDIGPDDLPPANMPGGNDPTPVTPAIGATRLIQRPEIASMAYSMMRAGAGFASIKAALGSKDAPFTLSMYNEGKKRLAANPEKNPFTASQEVPTTLMQRAAGSAPGAFTAQMANAATAGIPAYLAGEQGKGALDAMAAMHPTASMLGGLTGGVAGATGAEAALAARAPAALAGWAPRAADALFGGVSGYTGSDGDLGSAALGAIAAPIAGAAGDRLLRAAGSAFRGVTDPAVQYLRQRGVPLTVGQAVANSGRSGQFVKGMEDALTSVPGPGNMVDARRTEGLEAFNRAAFQDAAVPGAQVTAFGAPGMQQVRQSVSDAYDNALLPSQIDTVNDPQLVQDGAQALLAANSIPNVEPTLPRDFSIASLQNRLGAVDANGMMSGRNFQEAYRGLARDARGRAESDYGHEIGNVARQGQDALGEALERQNPGAFTGFIEANAGNRRANVLADALKNAANQGNELITPAQLNRADVQSTSRLEGKINSAAGNRPFYDLATAAQAVLPSKLPDSGTFKRLVVGTLATGGLGAGGGALDGWEGAGEGIGKGAALATLLAMGGTRTGQRALTSMLLDRPAFAHAIANSLQRHAQLGGGFGAGILTPLLVGAQN